MKLELSDLNNGLVYIGDKLNVRTKFHFEKETPILWSGIKLLAHSPCFKEIQIAKNEIFSKGTFEAGDYYRDRALLVTNNAVPTIKSRNLNYEIKLTLRQPHPLNPSEDDLIINKAHDITIKTKEMGILNKKPNPISFSMSGLNLMISKDIFKPGETMKINFSSEEIRHIEVRLLQEANIICYCEAYGQNCRKVEILPPAIAGDAKTSDIDKGYLLLKIPEIAEPTHNYLWEPTEKEHWGFNFGDYSKWFLLVLAKPIVGREIIKFEVPIMISASPIEKEKGDIDLFAKATGSAPSLFEGVSSKFQNIYKIISIDSDIEKYRIHIKNISKHKLEGVTVKLIGLQEALFETAPALTGFKEWDVNEEKEVEYLTKQNITTLISLFEDNSQRSIRIQSPLSSDFF
jgi:hypothetical protein